MKKRLAYHKLEALRWRIGCKQASTRYNRSKRWLGTSKVSDILASFNPGAEYCHLLKMTSAQGLRQGKARLRRGATAEICQRFGISRSTLWRILAGMTATARHCRTVLWHGAPLHSYERTEQNYLKFDMRKLAAQNKKHAVEAQTLLCISPEEEFVLVEERRLPIRWLNLMCDWGWSSQMIAKYKNRYGLN